MDLPLRMQMDPLFLTRGRSNPVLQAPPRYQASEFPKVDRTLKGDRLAKLPPEPTAPVNAAPANEDPSTSNALVKGAKTVERAPATETAKAPA